MKKLEYYSKKWKKKQEYYMESGENYLEEIRNSEEQYMKNNMDEVRYYYSLSLGYVNILQYYYAISDYIQFKKTLVNTYECFNKCYHLLENNSTLESTKNNIIKKYRSGFFGIIAYLGLGKEYVKDVASEDSSIMLLLDNREIRNEENVIDKMHNSIICRDSKTFNELLVERIKEIRKFNLDYYMCIDIWAVYLILLAKECGMKVEYDFAETNMNFLIE